MLGKDAIIEFFNKNNINHIFHLPGLQTLPLNTLLSQQKNITAITARHESNMVFMADGYARASGKPGVLIVTAGPGLGNIVSGCMEAFNSDVPLLAIHIDVERKDIGKGILHGLTEPEAIFKHITKKTYCVSDAGNIIDLLNDAYNECLSGRTGPVLISIPHTLLEKEVPNDLSSQNTGSKAVCHTALENTQRDLDLFSKHFEDLMRVKRKPLIIGGKALMKEEPAFILDEICRNGSIPLLTTTGGKGILREENPYVFGNIVSKGTARKLVTSSDIVIAIGTRLRDVDVQKKILKSVELVHIDIDNRWMDKNYSSRLKYTGNLEEALRVIQRVFRNKTFGWNLKDLLHSREQEESLLLKQSSSFALVKLLRKEIPENTTIVCDLNMPSYWCEHYLPVFCRNSFLMPRGIFPIFYSLPASIGAKLGRPERPCIALCGDGGALPTISEIATIKKYNVPVVIFIHNNNSFAILEDVMVDRYGVHNSMDLTNPDFVKIARAFGIKARRTDSLKGLEKIFRNNVTWDEPFLIELNQPVSVPPWKWKGSE